MSGKKTVNRTKETLINQNISQSKFGIYQNCQTGNCIKNNFNSNFLIGETNNICIVDVINSHAVDVLKDYCQFGLNAGFKDGWINPVALCSISDDFVGSNYSQSEGIRDDTFNIRTNYNCITRNNNPFPLKQNECAYNRYITVIRDNNLKPILDLSNLYRFSIISSAPINKPELLNENKMKSSYFIKMLCTIETIFQTAISGLHNVLVLTPFGNTEDNVPQEDIVKIYNSCIFKYGHRFHKIIIAVPIWHGSYIFDLFNNEIVRPQDFSVSDESQKSESESEESNDVKVMKKINKDNKNIKKYK
jgi:hypothetical protein